jgi:hypothetical protein
MRRFPTNLGFSDEVTLIGLFCVLVRFFLQYRLEIPVALMRRLPFDILFSLLYLSLFIVKCRRVSCR